MAQKRLQRNWLLGPLMLMACWAPICLSARPLPLPPGPLDTNIFNTNGIVIPPQVQFLLRDLQTNLAQVGPFLELMTGSNNATGQPQHSILPPSPAAVPRSGQNTETTNSALIYGLGAALENVQTDLQELLPRLAAMVGQTNYSSNSVQTNNAPVPNRLEPDTIAPAVSPQIEHTGASADKAVKPRETVFNPTHPL